MIRIIIILVISLVLFPPGILSQDFTRGVNLTSWFQTSSAASVHFGKYSKQDFENIKSLGCDVIRLPINLHSMTDGAPNYNLDPLLFYFLDQVIDWAEELEIHLILDNHSFDPAVDTNPTVLSILLPVWRQMAERYKDRSNLINYEILNEPHGINDDTWNSIQGAIIKAIREVDTTHTIIVGPAGWNSYHNLQYMPEYSDTNLIYTFHFYDPLIFTHQGASWTDPSMVELGSVPFPYDQSAMPSFPSSLIGTWIHSSFNNYSNDGTVAKVQSLIDIAVNFKEQRNVKIFCGEFGVYIPNSDNSDRTYWYEVVRTYLEEMEIAWTIWDYQGGFGLYEKGSNQLFDYDLNMPLIQALGLNEVEQSDFIITPDTTGFIIYSDFIENGIQASSWSSGSKLSYYNDYSPAEGNFSISWEDAEQYNAIGFDFIPNKDLGNITNDFSLRFYLKGDTPLTEFDIRFVDSKIDDPNDHPWRMKYTVNAFTAPFDSSWHLVEIPLKDFSEGGSWDNETWYNSIGAFDWSAVDKFEIVAEQKALTGISLWFDQIEIYDPNTTSVDKDVIENNFTLYQNFPNPFNPVTTIKYSIPLNERRETSNVKLIVYNILGREVATLINQKQKPGNYQISWDAGSHSSGIYFYKLIASPYVEIKKMILLK